MGNIILSDLLLLFASPQEQISVTRVAARGSVFSEHMEVHRSEKHRTCQSLCLAFTFLHLCNVLFSATVSLVAVYFFHELIFISFLYIEVCFSLRIVVKGVS